MTNPVLKVEQRGRSGKWWVYGVPGVIAMGPYATRREAESDTNGVKKFYRANKELLNCVDNDDRRLVLDGEGQEEQRQRRVKQEAASASEEA